MHCSSSCVDSTRSHLSTRHTATTTELKLIVSFFYVPWLFRYHFEKIAHIWLFLLKCVWIMGRTLWVSDMTKQIIASQWVSLRRCKCFLFISLSATSLTELVLEQSPLEGAETPPLSSRGEMDRAPGCSAQDEVPCLLVGSIVALRTWQSGSVTCPRLPGYKTLCVLNRDSVNWATSWVSAETKYTFGF